MLRDSFHQVRIMKLNEVLLASLLDRTMFLCIYFDENYINTFTKASRRN